MDDNLQRVQIRVSGKVQQVGFRFFTIDCAKSNNLTGWVRNRKDKTVEILVEGSESAINNFIKVVSVGPPMGRVDKTDIKYNSYTGEYNKFKTRFTK